MAFLTFYLISNAIISDGFSNFLTAAFAIMSIASLAGLGFVQSTVVNLRGRVKDLAEENKELKEKRSEDRTKIKELKTDMDALARVVTNEVHWEVLTRSLEDHNRDAEEHWAKMEKVVIETQAALFAYMRGQMRAEE